MTTARYEVVQAPSLPELEGAVTGFLQLGCLPTGGPVYYEGFGGLWLQAVYWSELNDPTF